MGVAIPYGSVLYARIPIRNGLRDTEVARAVGCNRKTVRSIREGRTLRSIWKGKSVPRVDHKDDGADEPSDAPKAKRTAPYVCEGCSRAAGYDVTVTLRPCVICAARDAKAAGVATI